MDCARIDAQSRGAAECLGEDTVHANERQRFL